MTRIIHSYLQPLSTGNGHSYTTLVCGKPRDDGWWEGWLEFLPTNGSDVLRSPGETTQPSARDLERWASGLTTADLASALARSVAPRSLGDDHAILDPFSLYAKGGEGLLRRKLQALAPRHLASIARTYDLAGERASALEQLSGADLVELIISTVRARSAA